MEAILGLTFHYKIADEAIRSQTPLGDPHGHENFPLGPFEGPHPPQNRRFGQWSMGQRQQPF